LKNGHGPGTLDKGGKGQPLLADFALPMLTTHLQKHPKLKKAAEAAFFCFVAVD